MNADLSILESNGVSHLRELFEAEHEKLFTYRLAADVELMNIRVISEEVKHKLSIKILEVATSKEPPTSAITSKSTLVFEGREYDGCAIWNRLGLKHGHVIYGPSIITQMDSNTVILPGFQAEIDAVGNILIWDHQEDPHSDLVAEKDKLDLVAVDIFENALRNARNEMDTLMTRTTMSPAIREQQDEFNVIAEPSGKMIVGQFGSFIGEFLDMWKSTIEAGDIFLTNDPYSVGGAVSHHNDWLILMPIFVDSKLSNIHRLPILRFEKADP